MCFACEHVICLSVERMKSSQTICWFCCLFRIYLHTHTDCENIMNKRTSWTVSCFSRYCEFLLISETVKEKEKPTYKVFTEGGGLTILVETNDLRQTASLSNPGWVTQLYLCLVWTYTICNAIFKYSGFNYWCISFPITLFTICQLKWEGWSIVNNFSSGQDDLQGPPQQIYIGLDLILGQRALPPMTHGPGQLDNWNGCVHCPFKGNLCHGAPDNTQGDNNIQIILSNPFSYYYTLF